MNDIYRTQSLDDFIDRSLLYQETNPTNPTNPQQPLVISQRIPEFLLTEGTPNPKKRLKTAFPQDQKPQESLPPYQLILYDTSGKPVMIYQEPSSIIHIRPPIFDVQHAFEQKGLEATVQPEQNITATQQTLNVTHRKTLQCAPPESLGLPSLHSSSSLHYSPSTTMYTIDESARILGISEREVVKAYNGNELSYSALVALGQQYNIPQADIAARVQAYLARLAGTTAATRIASAASRQVLARAQEAYKLSPAPLSTTVPLPIATHEIPDTKIPDSFEIYPCADFLLETLLQPDGSISQEPLPRSARAVYSRRISRAVKAGIRAQQ